MTNVYVRLSLETRGAATAPSGETASPRAAKRSGNAISVVHVALSSVNELRFAVHSACGSRVPTSSLEASRSTGAVGVPAEPAGTSTAASTATRQNRWIISRQ